MDLGSYTDDAVRVAKVPLPDLQALRELLADRPEAADRVDVRDLATLRALQRRLREVWGLAAAGREVEAVDALNALLARSPVVLQVSATDGSAWQVRGRARSAATGDDLAARALLGLAAVLERYGPGRLGICAAVACPDVFVDTSPGGTRRYCSERCASRSNVAAFRARQRRRR